MGTIRPEVTGGKAPTRSGRKAIAERLVYTVPEAGRLLGLGRNTAYEAAKRGEIPTIRMGRLLRVPKAALLKLVGVEPPGVGIPLGANETADDADEDAEEPDDETLAKIMLGRRSVSSTSRLARLGAVAQSARCGPFLRPRKSWRPRNW